MINLVDPLRLNLFVAIPNGTEDELDRSTRQLLAELKDYDIEAQGLIEGKPPEGTMGADPVTLGAIALVVLPTVLPKLIEFLQAWALRGQGRTVKIESKGGIITISSDDFQKLLEKPEKLQKLLRELEKGKKKGKK